MNHSTVAMLLAVSVLLSAPAWAGGAAGIVEICRAPNVSSIYDKQSIEMPPGSQFADVPVNTATPERDYRQVQLVLLQALHIPIGVRCVTIPAAIGNNPKGFPVGPNEHRTYQFAGNFRGAAPELVMYAKSDFR